MAVLISPSASPRNSWSSERLWRADLVDLITDAGQNPDRWQDVVEAFAAHWPGLTAAAVEVVDLRMRDNYGLCQTGMDPAFAKPYVEYYAHLKNNPWRDAMLKAPVMQPVLAADVASVAEIKNTEFYNDWVKPQGEVEHATSTVLVRSKDQFAQFALHYGGRRAEYFNRTFPLMMQKLAPALRSAVALNRVLRSKRALSAALDVVLDTLDSPAFVIDAKGKLRHANTLAVKAAEGGRLVRIAGGAVSFRSREAQSRLSQALAALSTPGGLACGDVPVVSAEGAVCALASFHAVKSAAIGQPLGWLTQPETWLLVIVRELGIVPGSIAPEGLKLLFGFTRAEARLAAALASGAALDDVAQSIGITRETARSQLKAIFAKTETHRQPELVALLARLARRP